VRYVVKNDIGYVSWLYLLDAPNILLFSAFHTHYYEIHFASVKIPYTYKIQVKFGQIRKRLQNMCTFKSYSWYLLDK